ncbi:MAG: glycoside hydrolase TIM-barrel-like domain-containing protein [Nitratireductor sp.]
MATVVLQVAGAAIGGAIGGPFGAIIGRAAGALAGCSIDQKLFGSEQVIRGGRLEETRFLAANEGDPVPRAYGRVRLGGQIIWATRFREIRKKKKQGGKGGPKTTTETYSYYANFAIGICEGEIAHIGRIWADGTEIDRTKYEIRLYHGTPDQLPDPLIEAKQGYGKAPAFRGTAYAVFEDFPIADYGNRIPQISFEVIRSVAAVDRKIRSVNLIPGATEFGYAPRLVASNHRGKHTSENRHNLVAGSDWQASLDELQALCPNLESINLVVAWYGNDLRVGNCSIEPRVTHHDSARASWSVSGAGRHSANMVSQLDGRAAFGGTPDDASLVAAIQDLKARGLKVTFYPFILMDVPAGNGLPDPHGAAEQPAFPWRGRITCHPAPGESGSPDGTSVAAAQIAGFLGSAQPGHFSAAGGSVVYSGPAGWGFRRMILHYAHLCELAGGVDGFLIGSELRGLTRLRNETGAFPFVGALKALAGEVRAICGVGTAISYAADWSEYSGYHPPGPDNDVLFNLDPLWADANVDFIAIDNYMPFADWHETGDPGLPGHYSLHDREYLQANIQGGEGYDWYYASDTDRAAGTRTPIADGLGEPWIWAIKNLKDWWLNQHFERIGGARAAQPTPWVPASKPFHFSELGCPAINRGANQPNVFVDAKSSESAVPYFSKRGRDDLLPLRFAEAHLAYWSEDYPDADSVNPVSDSYPGRMVAPSDISFWAWDARPYPAFPEALATWSDGGNWYRGHWLNGRLGTCPLDDLFRALFADLGLPQPRCELDGHLTGFVVKGGASLRAVLEPLLATLNLTVGEQDGLLVFTGKDRLDAVAIPQGDLVLEDDTPMIAETHAGENTLPAKIVAAHGEVESGYNTVTTTSRMLDTASEREVAIELPAVWSRDAAEAAATARLRDFWAARRTTRFSLGCRWLGLEAGDLVTLADGGLRQITATSHGRIKTVDAAGFARFEEAAVWKSPAAGKVSSGLYAGAPQVMIMNLPLAQGEANPSPRLYAAVYAEPWSGSYIIEQSPGTDGFETVATVHAGATFMELLEPLPPGPVGRWDRAATLRVKLYGSEPESLERLLVLSGRNGLAVETRPGEFEILQFANAELTGPDEWVLSNLLRGQLGSEPEMAHGAEAGATAVLLDETLVPIPVSTTHTGLALNYRVTPAGDVLGSVNTVAQTVSCTALGSRPLSPAHLRVVTSAGTLELAWIRRSRLEGDNWEIPDPPLDAASERYRVTVLDHEETLLRQWEVTAPSAGYSDAERLADAGSLQAPVIFEVAQLASSGRPGPPARYVFTPET